MKLLAFLLLVSAFIMHAYPLSTNNAYVECGGVLMMEIENGDRKQTSEQFQESPEDTDYHFWTNRTEENRTFFQWTTNQQGTGPNGITDTPGLGVIVFEFTINTPGKYTFEILSNRDTDACGHHDRNDIFYVFHIIVYFY